MTYLGQVGTGSGRRLLKEGRDLLLTRPHRAWSARGAAVRVVDMGAGRRPELRKGLRANGWLSVERRSSGASGSQPERRALIARSSFFRLVRLRPITRVLTRVRSAPIRPGIGRGRAGR